MKIFILLCNILVPVIMIAIGILYKQRLYTKINKILDLFIPIAVVSSGLGCEDKSSSSTNTNTLVSANKKCSLIWIVSGLCTMLITAIVLIVNRYDIINATTFLDVNNVSVIMLEVELAIVIAVFISVEYILKKSFYKKIDK